jgi:predicted porin
MNKKLLATAVGLVLAGGMGLASADVKLYGQIDVSIDAQDPVDPFDPNSNDDVNLNSNTSAIGVKGTEDLGNGMEAFFKVEYQTDITNDDNGDGWTGRDQYIGLGHENFGKLAFGTMSTAYKAQAAKIDPFYRASLQARDLGLQSRLHAGKGEEGHGRATNTIGYSSPNWSGFGLRATYTLDSDENDGPGGTTEDDDPWSVGATYSGLGGLYAFVSYVTTNSSGDDDATQIGAQWTFDSIDVEVHGIYEIDGGLITLRQYGLDDGSGTAGDGDGADVWSVGGSWTIGNNVIGGDYGQGGEVDNDAIIVPDDYQSWRIMGAHMFSDRTMVYAGYANVDPDETDDVDIFSVGARHKF